MTAQRTDMPTWLDDFPVEEQLFHGFERDARVFVDVGGGFGHQCLALIERFPKAKGLVTLQDTKDVIPQAAIDGVETMVYDFWTPQSVQGK